MNSKKLPTSVNEAKKTTPYVAIFPQPLQPVRDFFILGKPKSFSF
jgi:hypothetical protein